MIMIVKQATLISHDCLTAVVIAINSWKETTIVNNNNKLNEMRLPFQSWWSLKIEFCKCVKIFRKELQAKWLQGLKYEGHWLSRDSAGFFVG